MKVFELPKNYKCVRIDIFKNHWIILARVNWSFTLRFYRVSPEEMTLLKNMRNFGEITETTERNKKYKILLLQNKKSPINDFVLRGENKNCILIYDAKTYEQSIIATKAAHAEVSYDGHTIIVANSNKLIIYDNPLL